MPLTTNEEARRGYDAYGAVTDYKNYQGLPMPKWEELPPKIQEAWKAAAGRVMDDCLTQFQELDAGERQGRHEQLKALALVMKSTRTAIQKESITHETVKQLTDCLTILQVTVPGVAEATQD